MCYCFSMLHILQCVIIALCSMFSPLSKDITTYACCRWIGLAVHYYYTSIENKSAKRFTHHACSAVCLAGSSTRSVHYLAQRLTILDLIQSQKCYNLGVPLYNYILYNIKSKQTRITKNYKFKKEVGIDVCNKK